MAMDAMEYQGQETVVIHEGNYKEFIGPTVDGKKMSMGAIPRDYAKFPLGCYAAAKPFDLKVIPEEKWEAKLKEQTEAKARCSDIRMRGWNGKPIPSRDQDGVPYCWGHSSTSAALIIRAREKMSYADLSAFSICCKIKKFKKEGGWGAESLEFIAEHGIATTKEWPNQSMDRKNDNDATWEAAKRFRITEWMDLKPRNKAQLVTCLLNSIPVVVDFNWWSHSVCALDVVSFNPFRILIWNSWSDGWSNKGMGILEASKALPDGAIAPRVLHAA